MNQPYHGIIERIFVVDNTFREVNLTLNVNHEFGKKNTILGAFVKAALKDVGSSKIYLASKLGRDNPAKYEWEHSNLDQNLLIKGLYDLISQTRESQRIITIAFPDVVTSYSTLSKNNLDRLNEIASNPDGIIDQTQPIFRNGHTTPRDLEFKAPSGFNSKTVISKRSGYCTESKGTIEKGFEVGCPLELLILDYELNPKNYVSQEGPVNYPGIGFEIDVQESNKLLNSKEGALVYYGQSNKISKLLLSYINSADIPQVPYIAINTNGKIGLFRFGDPKNPNERETNLYLQGRGQYNDGNIDLRLDSSMPVLFKEESSIIAKETKLWAKAKTVQDYLQNNRWQHPINFMKHYATR